MAKLIDNPNHAAHPIRAMVALYNLMGEGHASKRTLREILRELRRIPTSTLDDIAVLCHTSRSSFLRLCYDLGYASYTEFRAAVAADLARRAGQEAAADAEGYLPRRSMQLIEAVARLNRTLDQALCRRIAELLHGAARVRIYDRIFSTFRLDFQTRLLLDGKDVATARSLAEQRLDVAGMDAGTLLLCAVEDSDGLAPLRQAAAKRATVVVMTEDPDAVADVTPYVFRFGYGDIMDNSICRDLVYLLLERLYQATA